MVLFFVLLFEVFGLELVVLVFFFLFFEGFFLGFVSFCFVLILLGLGVWLLDLGVLGKFILFFSWGDFSCLVCGLSLVCCLKGVLKLLVLE